MEYSPELIFLNHLWILISTERWEVWRKEFVEGSIQNVQLLEGLSGWFTIRFVPLHEIGSGPILVDTIIRQRMVYLKGKRSQEGI